MKETWIKIGMNALIIVLFGCIPAGIFLTFWFNDSRWLWLCSPILIFLS